MAQQSPSGESLLEELAAGASPALSFQARVRGDVLAVLVVNLAEVTGRG